VTDDEAYQMARDIRAEWVAARKGTCPHAAGHSPQFPGMYPCVRHDGDLVVSERPRPQSCVGCGYSLASLSANGRKESP
jgi:hypothetical protein